AARRTGQRAGPGGHPVGPPVPAVAGRRGTHGLPVVAPDERDGDDRRPSDRRRPGAPAGRRAHHRTDRRRVAGGRVPGPDRDRDRIPEPVEERSIMTTIGLTTPRIVSSEWRKQVSLRSTWWTWAILMLAIAAGVTNSVGVAVGALTPNPDELGPLGGTLSGLSAAEIVVIVLGALAVTGEYATGAVRSSFT